MLQFVNVKRIKLFFSALVNFMGIYLSKLFMLDARVLMLGLDAAGKTTILYRLKLNELLTTIPTIGFNVEEVRYKRLKLNVWDVGGQDKIRLLWRHYFENTDALIFVIDSSDRTRLGEAADELWTICKHERMLNLKFVLVFANKQDLPNAASPNDIATALRIDALGKKFTIQVCSATQNYGLHDGLDKMYDALRKEQETNSWWRS